MFSITQKRRCKLSHTDQKAKTIADQSLQQGHDVAAAATTNPYVTAGINRAGQDLENINAGKFGGLPLVQAVNQAAQRMRSWNPSPVGDSALAANAAGGSGYATAENEYRKRLQDQTISSIMPQAVEAERNYSTGVLYPGAASASAFELAKANALNGIAGQGNNIYQTSANTGFWNALTGSFGRSLGAGAAGLLTSGAGAKLSDAGFG